MHFNPKEIAVVGLTAMIKVLAQMKNLRRGHDAQGHLKRVKIDQTYEGYANFMAPMRRQKIREDVEKAKTEKAKAYNAKASTTTSPDRGSRKETGDLENIFTDGVLKPETETFLTPEWDEFVPFPTSKLPLPFFISFPYFAIGNLPTNPSTSLCSMENPL